MELCKHILAVKCFADGRIEMHGTQLGLFDGAVELLSRVPEVPSLENAPDSNGQEAWVTPRRRRRLRIPSLSPSISTQKFGSFSVAAPDRLANLPDAFRWSVPITLQKPLTWPEENAEEVGRLRLAHYTVAALAKHFGKSVDSIRSALKIAAQRDSRLENLPWRMPRPRWPELHYSEVGELSRKGLTQKQLCDHFGKSEPLIRRALRIDAAKQLEMGGESEANA
jgi:hypothetical protein